MVTLFVSIEPGSDPMLRGSIIILVLFYPLLIYMYIYIYRKYLILFILGGKYVSPGYSVSLLSIFSSSSILPIMELIKGLSTCPGTGSKLKIVI